MAFNQSKETTMIVKTDKDKKELESWETVELAAKAIGVSPKVLKGHLFKKKPPKLGGFVFIEKKETAFISKPIADKLLVENQKELNTLLSGEINYKAPSPEFFDSEKLSRFTADEAGLFNIPPPVMLDEYGEPVTAELPDDYVDLQNVEILGHTSFPVEDIEETSENEVNPNWLLSPIEQRLKRIREQKNS